jgi:hypothetical protein
MSRHSIDWHLTLGHIGVWNSASKSLIYLEAEVLSIAQLEGFDDAASAVQSVDKNYVPLRIVSRRCRQTLSAKSSSRDAPEHRPGQGEDSYE